MKPILFSVFIFLSGIMSAQCSGSFGEPVFVQDFGRGVAGSYGNPLPAGYTTYTYRNFTGTTPALEDGEYTLGTNARQGRTDWHDLPDHTEDDAPQQGYMLIVNASYSVGEFYRERVSGLCSGQTYQVSFWLSNVFPPGIVPNPIPVNVAFKVYDASGNLISQSSTGNINSSATSLWNYQSFEFQFDSTEPFVDIVLENNAPGGIGNDLAIDDIVLRPCQTQALEMSADSSVFTTGVTDNSGNFTVSVSGSDIYENPFYILQQSTDNGNTWTDISSGTQPQFTVPAGSYSENDQFRILVSEEINQGNLNCSLIVGPETVRFLNETMELHICDDDSDGIQQFDLQGLYNQLQTQYGTTENPLDEVYIANSYQGLIKIENVSTNPNRVNVCNSSFSLYEVAVDDAQQIYVSSQNGIFRVNTQTCSYQNLGNLPPNSNVAMSFDTQNNLYVGGYNHSKVYRADAGQFSNFYEWHDFGDGSSGGDFVVIGEFMYIAWAYNDDYFLFKVTVDADNQYVSHENLGSIPTDTFGLAAENGRLYGVTPEYLYSIDLNTLNTSQIIVNSGNTPWWGAAGLHEAIAFDISFHASLADAQNNTGDLPLTFTNTIAATQTIYISIVNENTGDQEIIPLQLIVDLPPETTSATLYECVPEGSATAQFNLAEAVPDMITDQNGITVTFFTSQSNAEAGTNPIQNISAYQTQNLPAMVYVVFDNGCKSLNTIELSGESRPLDLPQTLSFCEGESVTISVADNFDSFQWTGLQGNDIAGNDATSNEITVTNPGVYQLTAGFGLNCTVTAEVNVIQEFTPEFEDQSVAFCTENSTLDISVNDLITNLNGVNGSYFYQLFTNSADADEGINPLNGNITISDLQIIKIKVLNSPDSNCYVLRNYQIDLNPVPEFSLQDNYTFCEGENVRVELPTDFVSYQWNGLQGEDIAANNTNGNAVTLSQSGLYSITVENEFCSTTKEFSINFGESAVIQNVEVDGNTATIIANGTGTLEYSVNGTDWFSSPYFGEMPLGIHTAYVRGEEVCGITERLFTLFEITNIITPNGDGFNDQWEIKGISAYPDAEIEIYNRYGKLLIDRKAQSDVVWDGTYKGQPVPSGSYWYLIRIPDGRNFSGHITVKNF